LENSSANPLLVASNGRGSYSSKLEEPCKPPLLTANATPSLFTTQQSTSHLIPHIDFRLQLVLQIDVSLGTSHCSRAASCELTSHHTSRLKRPCEPHYLLPPLPPLNGRGSCSSKLEEPCKPHYYWLPMLAHLSSSLNNQPYFDSRSLPSVGFWWSPHHFPLPLSGVCARLPALCCC